MVLVVQLLWAFLHLACPARTSSQMCLLVNLWPHLHTRQLRPQIQSLSPLHLPQKLLVLQRLMPPIQRVGLCQLELPMRVQKALPQLLAR